MEFTVSKADLVRELNLSQGVVEQKTTIPILSNMLIEAAGDAINSDGDGSGVGDPLLVPARVKKLGRAQFQRKRLLDYVRLLPDAEVQVKMRRQSLGESGLRTLENADCRHVAREFPGVAGDAGCRWRRSRWAYWHR